MNIKFLQKKYGPVYLLSAGIFVFLIAFFYASRLNFSPAAKDNSNDLESANGNGPLDIPNPTIIESLTETSSPTVTKRPTAKITATPKPAVATNTLTPTSILATSSPTPPPISPDQNATQSGTTQ